MTFSRRRFFRIIVASAGFSALPLKASEHDDEYDYDLIIIGAGMAGLTAACIAAENGIKSIAVLESEPVIGGTSLIGNGFWAVAGTDFQKQHGVVDSSSDFRDDMLRIGNYVNKPELVEAFVKAGKAQYEWFLAKNCRPSALIAAESISRVHVFNMVELIDTLVTEIKRRGVRIKTGVRAQRLIRRNGRICAVETVERVGTEEYRARIGVVLATGGFSRNASLIEQYVPLLKKAVVISAEGANGDGLLMTREFGADVIDTQYIKASFGFIRNPSTMNDLSLAQYSGAIILNRNGERFVNESLPYKTIADAALMQPGKETYLVFDDAIRQKAMRQTPDDELLREMANHTFPDYLFYADTLSEVAVKAGLDPDQVNQSVEKYNRQVESGQGTDFGRTYLTLKGGTLLAIRKPPFFIIPTTPAIIGTYCGLNIDAGAAVLDKSGRRIPGLWAAGEITGGVHGASFMMGTALAKAAAFGRIAALSAVKEGR